MTAPVESRTETTTAPRCAQCEPTVGEHYCASCGKPLDGPRDLSVKQFFTDAIIAVTDLDSALIASFRSLFTKPGELTVEYLHGDRTRFMAPFRLFLLCNLIYFLAAAQIGMGVLTVPLRVQTTQMGYRDIASGMVHDHMHMDSPAMATKTTAQKDSIKANFAAKYDGATIGIGKIIVAVLIPFYAILFQILYAGRRRFFAEHLILATHLTAFLLVAIAGMGLIAFGVERLFKTAANDEVLFSTFFIVAFASYGYLAQRTVYQTGAAGAAVRTGLLALSMAPILVALKFVLFLVTLYWIG